jgi:hypothetical protein
MADREALGRLVREVWVEWAREQPDPKPSWLVPWEDLDDGQREVDMRIGEVIASAERPVDACPPSAAQIRTWLLAHGWIPGTRGEAGTAWHPPSATQAVGVPHDDDDPFLTAGALKRIAERSGLPLGYVTQEMLRSDD